MTEFFEYFVRIENLLFSMSLLIFVGLLALQLTGIAGDMFDGDLGDLGDLNAETGGVGEAAKCPLIFLLLPFFGSFGLLGMLSNWLLPSMLDLEIGYITLISVISSGVVSWETSKLLGDFLGRLLPSVESYGLSESDLAGCLGNVVGAKLGQQRATRISVTDARGGIFYLKGHLVEGHPEVLRGGLIRVIKHDAGSNVCFCEPASTAVMSDS